LTILGALAGAGIFLWIGSTVVIMSGTKATFSFVSVSAPPAGGVGGSVRTTTTTTTTAATTSITAPAAGSR
jgi:hypothetical protein